MDLSENFDKKSSFFWMLTGCIFVAIVGIADFLTGSELAFSLFYLFPIALVTWFSGKNLGLVISVIGALTWSFADVLSGQTYTQPLFYYWNAAIRLGFFIIVTLLLPALKTLEHEKEVARIDYLTGATNRRHFFEVAQSELDRSQRYKGFFTIVYIDLDDFKAVNDQFGHRTGDNVLCAVVNCAKSLLRKTDIIARLGGDELILLLPETDQDAAQSTIPKIQFALLAEMQQNHWPVTFSIGALTYQGGPITADELISKADDLMYSVKKTTKNAIAYAVYAADYPPLNTP